MFFSRLWISGFQKADLGSILGGVRLNVFVFVPCSHVFVFVPSVRLNVFVFVPCCHVFVFVPCYILLSKAFQTNKNGRCAGTEIQAQ